MIKKILTLVFLLIAQPAVAQDGPDQAIHAELRQLVQGIEQAINTEKYSDLKQYFDVKLRVTTINQQIITTPEGIDTYFESWFGKGGYLKKMDIKLIPDELTQLSGEPGKPTWGLAYGVGIENYELTDGRHLAMKTRWTATVTKGADEKWRILALHIGTNFYDNPILAEIQNASKYYAVGGGVLGVLLGGIFAWLYLRKKRPVVA